MIERCHLNILRAVDQQGTLTSAAEVLHLTQSALSHTIKKLELQIGTKLWNKQGRNLELTQVGQYLLREAHRLLPQLERIDEVCQQFAKGEKGVLRIGIECHPCYQWLLKIVEIYLKQWPEVDVDVKQQFQFGGMAALFNQEIDILVTPDPLHNKGISFSPTFSYEQVLVVSKESPLANEAFIEAKALCDQVLYSYPIEIERLDIYKDFLLASNYSPKKHKIIETTEMMLQMVAANRGVTTLPQWLVNEYQQSLPIVGVRLGEHGIQKQIFLGLRSDDFPVEYIDAFIELALNTL